MAYTAFAQMVTDAQSKNQPLWRLIQLQDMEDRQAEESDSLARMAALYRAMRDARDAYRAGDRSTSGLIGGDGARMAEWTAQGNTLCGAYFGNVLAQALMMGESNACMRRIVAAPTAGACGVLPAVLLPYADLQASSEEEMLHALYVAAGIGQVIASRACIAGAEGGCQAEIGSAAGMAAAALTFLRGGDAAACVHACALALKGLMGLVCDPVAGLVEVPCVKRNAMGAACALSAAEMALCGIRSAVPPDEVVDAMREVGEKMHASLRETGEGGLAATPTGQAVTERMRASALTAPASPASH